MTGGASRIPVAFPIASGTKSSATLAGGYQGGMAVFTVAKGGLMYEASIGGQKFGYKPTK